MFEHFFGKYLRFVSRHKKSAVLISFLIFAATLFLSAGLTLKSSLKELLPQNYESVVQLDKMLAKVGGISVLTVTVESENVAANEKFVDDLTARLDGLPKDEVRYVISKVDKIREFYEDNFIHYINIPDLEKLYARVKKLVDYEKLKRTPFFFDLGVEESPVKLNVDDIRERNEKNVKMPLAVFGNYYGGDGGRFLILMIRPQGSSVAVDKARALTGKVKGIVADLRPASYDPSLRVGFCGNLVTTVEEYDTLKHDMLSTAGLCVLLVCGVIVLYFLRLRIVGFLGAALLIGITFTFAVTRLAIGYLNTQTAFLASIIIGTGINYGIILIGRYLEERKAGMEPTPAMELALIHTSRPTFLAAATTAIAFAVLMIARVRGLSQFGFIGSAGVMLCWLSTILFLPPMVIISEKILRLVRRKLAIPKRESAIFPVMDKIIAHFSPAIIIMSVIAAIVAGIVVVRYIPGSIEYDFSKLRNKVSASEGTEALEKRVAKLWVGSMSPAVVLLDEPSDGPAVCFAVMAKNSALPDTERRVDYCATIYDLLPKDQDEKLPILERFDHLLNERFIGGIKGDMGERVRKLKKSLAKPKLEISDLPPELTRNFEDLEGRVGYIAYINPRSGMPLSDGRNLIRFARIVDNIDLPDGRVFHATGEYLIFADLINIVKEEAPFLTILSFICVSLFVVFSIRRINEAYVIVTALVWGVLMMVAAMAVLGIKINFFNFIALPLTFGIGVDYSINIGMRLHKDRHRRTIDIIRHTGGAVVLCSATTIIGYYVLTRSNNQAVAQFGLMAIIGEFTCIFAAMFLVPALVIVGRKLKKEVIG